MMTFETGEIYYSSKNESLALILQDAYEEDKETIVCFLSETDGTVKPDVTAGETQYKASKVTSISPADLDEYVTFSDDIADHLAQSVRVNESK